MQASLGLLLAGLLSSAPLGAPPAGQTGPSLFETGRVAGTSVEATGVRIEQTHAQRKAPRETRVQAIETPDGAPALAPNGMIDRTALSREIHARFASLNSCPRDVARRAHIPRAGLRASRLLLRWTIMPNGQVADTGVVAAAPADARVMNCVKKQMSVWSFERPTTGTVRVERPFRFK